MTLFSRHRQLFVKIALSVLLAFVPASPVFAQDTTPWTARDSVCLYKGDVATIQGLQCLIGNFLQIAVVAIGFIGFVTLVVSGFRVLASAGNTKGMDDARNALTWSVTGLLVALSAYFIIRIIAGFTGVDLILDFKIPSSDDPPSTQGL